MVLLNVINNKETFERCVQADQITNIVEDKGTRPSNVLTWVTIGYNKSAEQVVVNDSVTTIRSRVFQAKHGKLPAKGI